MFFNYLKADFMKTKHIAIRKWHLLIPILTAAVFLAYYYSSPWNPEAKIDGYFQMLGLGLPVLIGLFSAMTAEQETAAGKYQMMLSEPRRIRVFFSKLILLLLFELMALFLACGLFGTIYFYLFQETAVRYSFYWAAVWALFGSSILLYVFHFFIALKFNKGVTIGLGFVESLLTALLLTGLGESIWMYVPCAWGPRFTGLLLRSYLEQAGDFSNGRLALIVCVLMTLTSLCASGIWFRRWDGCRNSG